MIIEGFWVAANLPLCPILSKPREGGFWSAVRRAEGQAACVRITVFTHPPRRCTWPEPHTTSDIWEPVPTGVCASSLQKEHTLHQQPSI